MEKATANGSITPKALRNLSPSEECLIDDDSNKWIIEAIEESEAGFVLTTLRPGTTSIEQIRWSQALGFVDKAFRPIDPLNRPRTRIHHLN